MNFQIKNRFTGAVQFECELDADFDNKAFSLKLGFAIKKALKSGASLRGASLRGANLSNTNLRGVNLSNVDLSDADLSNADLRGAKMVGANLSGVNLLGVDLSNTDLRNANLSGAKMGYHIQEGLLLQIADLVIANPSCLEMDTLHTCDATHSLAGWACHLSPVVKELEKTHGAKMAGLLTLGAEAHSWFFLDNETVLENLQKLRS